MPGPELGHVDSGKTWHGLLKFLQLLCQINFAIFTLLKRKHLKRSKARHIRSGSGIIYQSAGFQNSSLSLNQEQQHLAVPHHWKQKQTSPNTSRSSKEKNQTGLASKTKDMNRLGIAWRQNSVNSLETKRHSSWAKGPKRQYGLENEAEFHYFQTICNISVNKNKNQKE